MVTPAATPTYTASVSWGLISGSDYRLLQTVASNELFASFGAALPSNADISITKSGLFSFTIDTFDDFGPNEYWAAFNDVTTTTGISSVPEPGSLTLVSLGLVSFAGIAWRKRKVAI